MEDRGRTPWGHVSSCLRGSFEKSIRTHSVIILCPGIGVPLPEGLTVGRPERVKNLVQVHIGGSKMESGMEHDWLPSHISLKIARQADGGSLSSWETGWAERHPREKSQSLCSVYAPVWALPLALSGPLHHLLRLLSSLADWSPSSCYVTHCCHDNLCKT